MSEIATKAVCTVTVIDPDSQLPVELEIRKLETGGMAGIDASFLAQDVAPVYSPYDRGIQLEIPDDETTSCPDMLAVISISDKEVDNCIRTYLDAEGLPEGSFRHPWPLTMNLHSGHWATGTQHLVTVEPQGCWDDNHDKVLADVRARGAVSWVVELKAVLNVMAAAGRLRCGNYLIEIQ